MAPTVQFPFFGKKITNIGFSIFFFFFLKGSPLYKLKEGRPSWQMDSSAAVATVDMELERCSQGGRPELRSQTAVTQGQSANFTHADVGLLE